MENLKSLPCECDCGSDIALPGEVLILNPHPSRLDDAHFVSVLPEDESVTIDWNECEKASKGQWGFEKAIALALLAARKGGVCFPRPNW